jgi:VanZ family protein
VQKVVISSLARATFWIALLVVLAMTLAPVSLPAGILNDKIQHCIGFFGLSALGIAGWGTRSALRIGIALAALGGAIELLQATRIIGRDAEVADWLADVAGILLALLPAVFISRTR